MRKRILLCILLILAAAALCGCRAKRLPEGVSIESLSYESRGMMAGTETCLSIFRENDGFVIVRTGGLGESFCKARGSARMGKCIADILRGHNALLWDGFSGYDPRVLDGESFTLLIAFDDGTTISARGANSCLKGMRQALEEIENLIDRLAEEPE